MAEQLNLFSRKHQETPEQQKWRLGYEHGLAGDQKISDHPSYLRGWATGERKRERDEWRARHGQS